MKDILKQYKKHKNITNLGILVTSLIMALGINLFIIDGSEMGSNLKANLLESQENKIQSDIFIKSSDNSFELISNKDMKDVESISLSLVYNPEDITLTNFSAGETEVINLNNNPGYNSIIISLGGKDIQRNEGLVLFEVNKLKDITKQLNIINANFKDSSGETYVLSTTGITF